jgi:hypothetical protein
MQILFQQMISHVTNGMSVTYYLMNGRINDAEL